MSGKYTAAVQAQAPQKTLIIVIISIRGAFATKSQGDYILDPVEEVNWEILHEAKSWSKSFSDVYYNRYWLPDANAHTYDKGVASSSLSDAVILSSDIRGNHRPQRINPSTGPFEWGYNSNMSGNPLSLLLL